MGSRLRDNVKNSFEYYCEVGRNKEREPYIIMKIPESSHSDSDLPSFAFPCDTDPLVIQHYSFVLTASDAKFTFCFCRYDPKTEKATVIVSMLPWHDIFFKCLHFLASLSPNQRKEFLESFRTKPPKAGHILKISYNNDQDVFVCKFPDKSLPSIPDNFNLTEYFSAIDAKCMAGLWAALLNERKVVVVASKLSRLSAIVQAANATLFPMSWQHIYIPIVPKQLICVLSAPMPFLVGVPKSLMEENKPNLDTSDLVILDADDNKLITPFDDFENLPDEVVVHLKRSLNKNALGDQVSRAFLRALVTIIGGYRDAIRIERGKEIGFNQEEFVKTRNRSMQPFLRTILQLQIFQQFIQDRLALLNSGCGFNDEFEKECYNYSQEMSQTGGGQKLKKQYNEFTRVMRKESGAILTKVKDKTNPAFKSAVDSLRSSGQSVKTAVKGIKSKMPRKMSSRPSSACRSHMEADRFGLESTSSGSSMSLRSETSTREPDESPIDLLNEMEILLGKNNTQEHDSPKLKARSLGNPAPPIKPRRIERYPITPIGDLLSSPPPVIPPRTNFVSHLTKDEVGQSTFHTRTAIHFAQVPGSSGGKLRKFSLSLAPIIPAPATNINSKTNQALTKPIGDKPISSRNKTLDVSDLIQLKIDENIEPTLEDFDPLKRNNNFDEPQRSADSALLEEYGIDFSVFNTPSSWCTFPNS